ncbi:hypothetical protein BpHYR1_034530 [Brachionus plicatilis]|uniref:Uncharacterized protein n=1 Tax=Brachionus plicatilis TaxID=10195 RepID=A0A3M7SG45_BRAPC|nr:hypothetical protein BpHYR1_034530 [Brachionus plicatilis]
MIVLILKFDLKLQFAYNSLGKTPGSLEWLLTSLSAPSVVNFDTYSDFYVSYYTYRNFSLTIMVLISIQFLWIH